MQVLPYERTLALAYARRWAFSRNPNYYAFDNIGGDCTNYASQCLFAGCGVMNETPTFGWYYHSLHSRSPAWTGVEYLYRFLVKNEGKGPFGAVTALAALEPADLLQLSFDGVSFTHCPLVVSIGDPTDPATILLAAHSDDAYGRPLSTYPAKALRPIHILGCRRP